MRDYLLALFIFFSFFGFSQSQFLITGDTVVSDSSHQFHIVAYLTVKNISNDTLPVVCEKNVMSQGPAATNEFCWAGNCYSSLTMVSSSADTLDPGEASTEFTGYYKPNGYASTAIIEYCFYSIEDPANQTCHTVTYHAIGGPVGISEDVYHDYDMEEFFPNPTSDYVFVEYSIKEYAQLEIMDILGNVVRIIDLFESGKERIDVTDLSKGIYFGSLIHNGEIIKTNKLIINK